MEKLLLKNIETFYKNFGIKYRLHDQPNLVLHRYFGFRLKYIVRQRRKLFVSKELAAQLNNHPAKDACYLVLERIATGDDINMFQGKGLINADFHDDLFNDWGIHHLHLSATRKKPTDYFMARSDYLLFVRFENNAAYFLDIHLHKDKNIWAKKSLIRIIHDNWPTIIETNKTGFLTPDFSDEEVYIMRRKGYTFGINVDEKTGYLMLGHGYACSGDNMMAGQMANEVQRWMWANRELFDSNPEAFERQLRVKLYIN